jgi:hypothetical protein
MFSGRTVIIRSNLTREQALKYEKAIRKTGAECLVLKDRSESGSGQAVEISSNNPSPDNHDKQEAQKDFSYILESYRAKCRPPQCCPASDIPKNLRDEITGIWEKSATEEQILAWFEVKRYPGKVFGMLLTDKHLHVRSETSGKRSIPIGEIGRMRIMQKNKKWELEFGVSNLYRDLPKTIHEPLEHFLHFCYEIGGLKPKVEKRVVTEKAESSGTSDSKMTPVYIVGALVTILANTELLVSAGANPIVAFIIGSIILLLLPTVIGLAIGSYVVGLMYDLPGLAMAFRCLFGGFLGAVAGLIIGYPLECFSGANKKKPVELA